MIGWEREDAMSEVKTGTLISAEEAEALGASSKRELQMVPDVEGQAASVAYVECPTCHVVSRVVVDTDGPSWGICSSASCGAMIRL
jgi:hypothetical protein